VVTLGQQLVKDGSPITIPAQQGNDAAGANEANTP
jgi:hypothetical protein